MSILSSFEQLSLDELRIVLSFLKITDIVQFSLTNKEFYNYFNIKRVTEKSDLLVENKIDAQILYLTSTLEDNKLFGTNLFTLQLLNFNITTKDQGWVKDC
jgi:hypothetical protein